MIKYLNSNNKLIFKFIMGHFNFFKSKAQIDLIYIFLGNTTFAGISFINMTLIARYLGPYEYGNFSLLYAILSIIIIISDFGLGISLVKFYSEFISKGEFDKTSNLIKISFMVRLISSLIICICGIIFSYTISKYILNNVKLTISLVIIFIGGIGISLFEFIKTYLQSKQKFKNYVVYINFYNILNLILLLILIFHSSLTVLSAIIIYSILPFLIFIIAFLLIDNTFLFSKSTNLKYKKIMKFNIFVIITNLCSMFFNRIDLFYLNLFMDSSAVGFYSAGYQMTQIITILTNSITFILLPKISSLTNIKEIKNTYKLILKYSTLLFIAIIPLIFIAPYILLLILSDTYVNSIPIFQILIPVVGLSFIINPLSTIIYKIDKPKILTLIIIIELMIIVVFEPFFIIIFEIFGVVYIYIITHVIALVFLILYLYFQLFIGDNIF